MEATGSYLNWFISLNNTTSLTVPLLGKGLFSYREGHYPYIPNLFKIILHHNLINRIFIGRTYPACCQSISIVQCCASVAVSIGRGSAQGRTMSPYTTAWPSATGIQLHPSIFLIYFIPEIRYMLDVFFMSREIGFMVYVMHKGLQRSLLGRFPQIAYNGFGAKMSYMLGTH